MNESGQIEMQPTIAAAAEELSGETLAEKLADFSDEPETEGVAGSDSGEEHAQAASMLANGGEIPPQESSLVMDVTTIDTSQENEDIIRDADNFTDLEQSIVVSM